MLQDPITVYVADIACVASGDGQTIRGTENENK